LCTFGGARLSIDEGVFCPTFTNVSPLLLRSIRFAAGQHVLDVFAGCGAFAIIAALHGTTTVTVDISHQAVACTLHNAALNNVEERLDARIGTLGECVAAGESFDLVVANPPLLSGTPTSSPLSAALFDPSLQATIDLVTSLPRLLAPDGQCFLVTSDAAERVGCDVESICSALGLTDTCVGSENHGVENYRVHRIGRT
jgi:methylase of polypeptide subunit release factors